MIVLHFANKCCAEIVLFKEQEKTERIRQAIILIHSINVWGEHQETVVLPEVMEIQLHSIMGTPSLFTLLLWLSIQKLVAKTMLHSLAVSTVCSMVIDKPIIILAVKILADSGMV